MNKLFYGDNLTRMQKMQTESIDLIYLDPPFNSNRSYNLLYKNTTGLPVPESVEAFCDAWELDSDKSEMAKNLPMIMREKGIDNDVVQFWYYMIQALRNANPKMLAYLIYMTLRLVEMHRLLKSTGSIYLHCDPSASHYLKVMMDGIFGHDNFRNEIIWKRGPIKGAKATSKQFGRMNDVILFYTKTESNIYNQIYKPYDLDSKYNKFVHTDKDGRLYSRDNPLGDYSEESIKKFEDEGKIYVTKNGKRQLIRYYDESKGVAIGSLWDDISPINQVADERLGYPTQKPVALLDRIVRASSNEGDIVFDPFCGCGTTIESCIKNGRQWIGCDVAIHSINLTQKKRISKYNLEQNKDYIIDGVPQSEEQAKYLFDQDPFQFQFWAVEKTGGFCSNKKTADGGIDGKIYFEVEGKLCGMVLSVKGGHVRPTDIRDLRGVLERENNTEMAGFITLQLPSKAMLQEANMAGYYEYKGEKYSRIQIMTVKEIFDGKFWHCPSIVKSVRKEAGQMYFAI